MDALNTKIKSILTEKTLKVRPENIKKDVEMFGITGTYEGSEAVYPSVSDSQCIGGGNNTSLTASVTAIANNVVYAMIVCRSTITMSNDWTLLTSNSLTDNGTTQTTYIYYQIPSTSGTVTCTVTQSSNVRMFLSLFAMDNDIYAPSGVKNETFTSSPSLPQTYTLTNVKKSSFIICSKVLSNNTADPDFSTTDPLTKYATTADQDRMAVFFSDKDYGSLVITADGQAKAAITVLTL